jgi:hypothetical protein
MRAFTLTEHTSRMDLLDRLHDRLTAALEAAGDEAYPGGLTVADVYQRLIPYRVVRNQVGVVELAEYEHALLRLLSGERHYIEVTDPTVRLEIQRELASLNPILGIYRDYSATAIKLGGGPVEGEEEGIVETAEPLETERPKIDHEQSMDEGPFTDLTGPSDRRTGAYPSPGSEPTVPTIVIPPFMDASPDACGRCGRALPEIPDLQFCPFCGSEQEPPPCGRCGAAMDRVWSFCARCGAARGSGVAR